MKNQAQRWFLQGVAHIDEQRWREALACFEQVLKIKPDNAASWSNKATSLMKLGRLDDALASCVRAVSLDPRFADGWANQGLVLAQLERVDEALQSLRQAHRLGHPVAERIIAAMAPTPERAKSTGAPQDQYLGYHTIGDFHFFTALPEAAKWLGLRAEDTFHSQDAFLSLVTGVHETYHVMQELFLGLCCRISASREPAATTGATVSSGSDTVHTDNLEHALVYSSALQGCSSNRRFMRTLGWRRRSSHSLISRARTCWSVTLQF